MKKHRAHERPTAKRLSGALIFAFVALSYAGKGNADEHGRFPSATYYTVIAHPNDSVVSLAARYRVPPSLVSRLNGVGADGRLSAGRVVLIPAINRSTREAVLFEARNRSAPNYATRPPPSGASFARPATIASASVIHSDSARNMGVAERPATSRFSWPITGPVISSFGPGAHGSENEGINIAAERGAPFRAAASGTVSYAGPFRGYGNLILLTHSGGFITAYAHADNLAVARGETVEKGHVIGTVGISGGVDRPQLHFEIRRGVTPIDPYLLLAANT